MAQAWVIQRHVLSQFGDAPKVYSELGWTVEPDDEIAEYSHYEESVLAVGSTLAHALGIMEHYLCQWYDILWGHKHFTFHFASNQGVYLYGEKTEYNYVFLTASLIEVDTVPKIPKFD